MRHPEEAILSFHIYSKYPLAICIERYLAFYADALEHGADTAVATFDETTTNFQRVIEKVRKISNLDIPIEQDYTKLKESSLTLVKKNADRLEPEVAVRQMAAPHEGREKLKDETREEIISAVRNRKDIWELYERGLNLAAIREQANGSSFG